MTAALISTDRADVGHIFTFEVKGHSMAVHCWLSHEDTSDDKSCDCHDFVAPVGQQSTNPVCAALTDSVAQTF